MGKVARESESEVRLAPDAPEAPEEFGLRIVWQSEDERIEAAEFLIATRLQEDVRRRLQATPGAIAAALQRLRDTVGDDGIITAPAAGTILTRPVNPGDPIVPLTSYQPGTEMATVADMSDLIFKGTVDEIDVGKLSVGMLARIKVGALPADVVTGHVSRIAPQAQQKEGATLFDVEIELDPSNKVTLRAGYSANADVIIREKKDVLTIPERLVTFEAGGKKASVELGDGPKAAPKKVEIKTGISDGLNVEVISGLRKGDKIIERPPKEIS